MLFVYHHKVLQLKRFVSFSEWCILFLKQKILSRMATSKKKSYELILWRHAVEHAKVLVTMVSFEGMFIINHAYVTTLNKTKKTSWLWIYLLTQERLPNRRLILILLSKRSIPLHATRHAVWSYLSTRQCYELTSSYSNKSYIIRKRH